MSEHEERVLGWDDEISNDGNDSFVVLPPGTYRYEIVNVVRGRHEPKENGKLPPCPKAEVTVRCYSGDEYADVKNNLFLHSRCEGMLCQFFRSIGQRKHGEPLKPDWTRVIGSRGQCKVGVRTYTTQAGEKATINEIKSFLDPPVGTAAPASPPANDAVPFNVPGEGGF